ncbi:MAG TPA: hypothetical protein DCO77_11290 [Nitrospiraceae bacterium]|nr:hypothetical protein [Nitrospiraceae bacterium]
MTILTGIGIFAIVFGVLFLFLPNVISKMAEWSNRMITRTDDLIVSRRKSAGIFLILSGLFILVMVYLS